MNARAPAVVVPCNTNVLLGNVKAGQAQAFSQVSSSAAARLWWQPRESFALHVKAHSAQLSAQLSVKLAHC